MPQGIFMKKKNQLIGMAATLFALLFATGCPQEADNTNPKTTPAVLVSAISIGGIPVDPLPQAAARMGDAADTPIVLSTERPKDADETTNVYYRPVQKVSVTLADVNETAFFAVSPPGEYPTSIELPGTPEADGKVARNISVTAQDDDSFPEGQIVWIKVVSADESKTEYYKIAVVSKTHDTAISSIAVNGNNVLNDDQSNHIGVWDFVKKDGAGNVIPNTWATAIEGIANLSAGQAAAPSIALTFRNQQSDLAKPTAEYAKILAANASAEPSGWSSAAPASFANHDILAVRAAASNGTTVGYLKITVNVGGIALLSSLKVNNVDIALGNPKANIAEVEGAYRVEEAASLSATPVQWAINAIAEDTDAAVSWALVANGATPEAGDFGTTSPASFDTSHNYLFIKVVSQNGETTMYYQVIYDERPRDTEHIKVGNKNAPVYKFTIPDGKSWADLGENPVVKLRLYMNEAVFTETGNNHRNFVFGELQRVSSSLTDANKLNTSTFACNVGASGFNTKMPFLVDRVAKDLAENPGSAAPGVWFTVTYYLTERDGDTRPWDPNTDWNTQNAYDSASYYPLSDTTGDVYFGIGVSSNGTNEYWVKELSLQSDDGTFTIPCDLLGTGRVDSSGSNTGFCIAGGAIEGMLRELVSDPSLR
jgi:hypothetical protein